jgi:threonine dehydrogenase-like Zn-dependent dehydrogenase
MLAAVLHNFNDLRLEEIPIPKPINVGEVLVKIKSCGICATVIKLLKESALMLVFRLFRGTSQAE